jgi:hypothetical protein
MILKLLNHTKAERFLQLHLLIQPVLLPRSRHSKIWQLNRVELVSVLIPAQRKSHRQSWKLHPLCLISPLSCRPRPINIRTAMPTCSLLCHQKPSQMTCSIQPLQRWMVYLFLMSSGSGQQSCLTQPECLGTPISKPSLGQVIQKS